MMAAGDHTGGESVFRDLPEEILKYMVGRPDVYEPHKHIKRCHELQCPNKKFHKLFTPIYLFNFAKIKKKCELWAEYIKVTSDLTVRINAHMTMRRKICVDDIRSGTGVITQVTRNNRTSASTKCTCFTCEAYETGNTVVGEVEISTHPDIITCAYEAKKATMRLFYESEDSQIKIIHGFNCKEFSSNGEEVKFRSLICDEELFNELEDKMRRFEVLKLRTETHPT